MQEERGSNGDERSGDESNGQMNEQQGTTYRPVTYTGLINGLKLVFTARQIKNLRYTQVSDSRIPKPEYISGV